MHFTPTSGSWLTLIFSSPVITGKRSAPAPSPPSRTSRPAIGAFIDGWNERSHPFIWTKTPDEILSKAHRKKTSNTRH